MKMEMQIKFDRSKLQWVLTLLFLLVLLAELYLAYFHLYSSIFGFQEEPPLGNVVRVNLTNYENTVEYLEGLHSYEPEPLQLPRSNPFQ